MAQIIDELDLTSPGSELDFGKPRKKTSYLEGATFKNNDLLSSAKLRELEALLTQPWPTLLAYIEDAHKRYLLLSDNGMELQVKERFFQKACDKALVRVLEKTSKERWAAVYPNLTLAHNGSERPADWAWTHSAFTALIEFMVRELSLSSTVLAWIPPGSKEDLLQ